MVAFNGPACLVQDFTRDSGAIAASMDSFNRWGGGTSLYDTLAAAGVELAWGREGRQAAVVLTDGVDTLSRIDVPRLRNYLRRTDVVVSAFLLPPNAAASQPGARFFERDMQVVSAETGGVFVRLRDWSDLEGAFHRLAEDLQNRYYIAYHSDRAVRAGAWRSVKVAVRRPGAVVHFRRGAIAHRDIADYLLEDLMTGGMADRRKAAEWLGTLGAGAEPLMEALRDRAPEVRAAAALALGRVREPRAIDLLIGLLGDPGTEVRHAAVEALQTFGPVAVPRLIAVLETEVGPDGSGRRGNGWGVPGSGPEDPRLRALEVLGRIGDPRGFATIARLAQPPPPMPAAPGPGPRKPAADPRLRLWALAALGDLGRAEGVPILVRATADRQPRIRQAALAALGTIAVPDAVPALLASVADPDRETRALAHRALAGLLRDGGSRLAGRLDTVPAARRERLLDECLAPLVAAAVAASTEGNGGQARVDPAILASVRAAVTLLEETRYAGRLIAAIAPDVADPLRPVLEERHRRIRAANATHAITRTH